MFYFIYSFFSCFFCFYIGTLVEKSRINFKLKETIKAKDAEILKAREIVNGFWAWFHIKSTRTAPNEFLEKAKVWLEENK